MVVHNSAKFISEDNSEANIKPLAAEYTKLRILKDCRGYPPNLLNPSNPLNPSNLLNPPSPSHTPNPRFKDSR